MNREQANKKKLKELATRVKKDPRDSFSKFALALELIKIDEVNKALTLFESVYEQDPEYLGLYYHLGKLYEHFGRFTDAEQMYQKGISLAEKKGEAHAKSELTEALHILEIEKNHDH